MKVCSVCKAEKPLAEFYWYSKTGRFNSRCNQCERKYVSAYKLGMPLPNYDFIGPRFKTCTKCEKAKCLSAFVRHKKANKDGYTSSCSDCRNGYSRERVRKISLNAQSDFIGPRSKICSRCGETKSITEFKKTRSVSGFQASCKTCGALDRKKDTYVTWQAGSNRKKKLRKYSLTELDYLCMLDSQEGVCAICQNPCVGRRLAVDHSHSTGMIRDLLCRKCNVSLGFSNDNPSLLRRKADYLDFWNSLQSPPEDTTFVGQHLSL